MELVGSRRPVGGRATPAACPAMHDHPHQQRVHGDHTGELDCRARTLTLAFTSLIKEAKARAELKVEQRRLARSKARMS